MIVRVTGEQTDAAGEVSRIEMTAPGKHYFRAGKHYILYEDETLAVGAAVSTMLKVAQGSLTLKRRGAVEQEQCFVPAQERCSHYCTLYGKLELSVVTKRLAIDYGAVSGQIDVTYDMRVNGEWQSTNKLHIDVVQDGGAEDTAGRPA